MHLDHTLFQTRNVKPRDYRFVQFSSFAPIARPKRTTSDSKYSRHLQDAKQRLEYCIPNFFGNSVCPYSLNETIR